MIKINDEFSFSTDPHNWILHHTYMGEDRKGNPKRQTKETYHPNLEKLCDAILDKACMEAPSIEEIKEAMYRTKTDIKRMLKEVSMIKGDI